MKYLLRKNWAVRLTAVMSPVGTRTPIWIIAWRTCIIKQAFTLGSVHSHDFKVQSEIQRNIVTKDRNLRNNYLFCILLINTIKSFQQASSDIWAYTAKGPNKSTVSKKAYLSKRKPSDNKKQETSNVPSHHPKIIKNQPSTINIIHSDIPRMLQNEINIIKKKYVGRHVFHTISNRLSS